MQIFQEGCFISFEGGEGVGKSLLISALRDRLQTLGFEVLTTREPGGTPQADRIRSLFSVDDPEDTWLPLTEAFLIAAARHQHVKHRIMPALAQKQWVLCDRFTDSTRVYQGAIPPKDLDKIIHLATCGLKPELTFLLDCPIDTARMRVLKRQGTLAQGSEIERFDAHSVAIHEERRKLYLQLAQKEPDRIVVLNAEKKPSLVLEQALKVLASHPKVGEKFSSQLKLTQKSRT